MVFLVAPFLVAQENSKTTLRNLFHSNAYHMDMPYEEETRSERNVGILGGASLVKSLETHAFIQVFSVASQETMDQFKLRRGEISFKGVLTDSADFFVMFDPVKGLSENKTVSGTTIKQFKKDASILQDLGLTFKVLNNKLVIGQFKRPISLEALQSSGALELLERATVVQILGDKRDVGAMVQGEVKTFKLQYMIALFNGEGPNNADLNKQKDVSGMLTFKPWEEAQLYVSVYEGTQGAFNDAQTRYGVGGLWNKGPYVLKMEYLTAKDGSIEKDGWYILGAYSLSNLGVEFLKPVRLAVRYEEWDADTANDVEIHLWTFGGQYFLDEKGASKLAADIFYQDGKGQEKDDLGLMFGFQGKF